MKSHFFRNVVFITFLLTCIAFVNKTEQKPVLYIIGDSTVKNGLGDGAGGLWGWGDFIADFFDTSRIEIVNDAIGGRSSRTFQEEGRWDKVLEKLHPGDFILIQFGHNDNGSLNKGRARGTLKGCGDDSVQVVMKADNTLHTVHSFGWYMMKYIRDTKAIGATPIILSNIPRNIWETDKVIIDSYVGWAKTAAEMENANYVDLNQIIREYYDKIGPDVVKLLFFKKDHTHTTEAGAILNAYAVVRGIKTLKGCNLKDFVKD